MTSRSVFFLSRIFRRQHRTFSSTKQLGVQNVYSEEKATHFGYETVTEKEKADKVYSVFENVSSNYDLMNDAMSFGIHRIWKDCFMLRLAPMPGTRLLDVAGGTGDIAFRFLDYINNLSTKSKKGQILPDMTIVNPMAEPGLGNSAEMESQDQFIKTEFIESSDSSSGETENDSVKAVVCDINEAMLKVGKERAKASGLDKSLSWVKGDAEKLPFPDSTFDACTIAFGIRNVVHIDKALTEAYRVLKPGGRFMCLEFSRVHNPLINSIYDAYSFSVIPVLGQIIARDWKSYQYLVESIRKFPEQETFKTMLEIAGFQSVTYENLSFGVAAIHSGFKF